MDAFLLNERLMMDMSVLRLPEPASSLASTESQNNFKLVIPSSNRPVFCSKKVIDSSLLLMDMLEYVNEEDPGYDLASISVLITPSFQAHSNAGVHQSSDLA